jgi:Flp pilus assembly protein TadD
MKDLNRAEVTLRRALAQPNADPKVRQNLALIVGLRGNFDEAERIAREGVSAAEASANVEYLRQMLARQQETKKPAAARPQRSNPRG